VMKPVSGKMYLEASGPSDISSMRDLIDLLSLADIIPYDSLAIGFL